MEITVKIIEAAEKILGVTYTDAERKLMASNLAPQIETALRRRSLSLPNGMAPALRFDPRLPGFPTPPAQVSPVWSNAAPGPLPDRDSDIAFAPVARLRHWIARGDLTSERLTHIYLHRIEAYDGKLNSFVTVLAESALAEAKAMDALMAAGTNLGPLHGIPYALKDIFDAAGTRTTWGAEPFADRIAEADAAIVTRLRAAGAVLLGKSAVGALAYGDVWLGKKTRNPWNLEEGSSGSSAGSGAATAAGLCGFSIGTETLGSITSPSERCGATGLRPTYGRVSRAGCMALCWSLDKVGPICRSVEDTAIVLHALNGGDPQDPGSIDIPFNYNAQANLEGVRVGYLEAAYTDKNATAFDHATLDRIKRIGLDLRKVTLEELPYEALIASLYAEAAASFEELTLSGADDTLTRQDDGAWPNAFRKARFLSAVDHVQLDRMRRQAMHALDKLFQEVDVLIGPMSTGPMLTASNFTGQPCLQIRAGFEALASREELSLAEGRLDLGESGCEGVLHSVPRGLSIWAGLFDESRLLNLGTFLESQFDVANDRPIGFD